MDANRQTALIVYPCLEDFKDGTTIMEAARLLNDLNVKFRRRPWTCTLITIPVVISK